MRRRPVKKQHFQPNPDQMRLWPDISGNTIHGLGETEVRPASPIYWHAPDATPHGHLQQWMGTHSAKNPAPGREQMLEERKAIQSREPVEIAAPAVQDDPIEWHKKVHDEAAALGAELVGIAPMDPLWVFEGCKTDKPWVTSCWASSWTMRY